MDRVGRGKRRRRPIYEELGQMDIRRSAMSRHERGQIKRGLVGMSTRRLRYDNVDKIGNITRKEEGNSFTHVLEQAVSGEVGVCEKSSVGNEGWLFGAPWDLCLYKLISAITVVSLLATTTLPPSAVVHTSDGVRLQARSVP